VEKRFEAFDERNGSFVIWSCATTLSVIGVVIAPINHNEEDGGNQAGIFGAFNMIIKLIC